jgi:phage host-nuclease inhibitor protein Gam
VKLNIHTILQVAKVGAFTSKQVSELSTEIDELQQRAAEASPGSKDALTKVGASSTSGELCRLIEWYHTTLLNVC